MKSIDVVLINPGGRDKIYQNLANSHAAKEPPVWLGIFASFLHKLNYSYEIIDANALNQSPADVAESVRVLSAQLVVVVAYGQNPSASTMAMPACGDICGQIKQLCPEQPVILVGGHVAALPEKTFEEECVDYVCTGEGLYTVVELIEALKNGSDKIDRVRGLLYKRDGKIQRTAPSPLIWNLEEELSEIPWKKFPMEKYRSHNWHSFSDLDHRQPYAAIYTSLGCPFDCSFCCIQAPFKEGEAVKGMMPGQSSYRMFSPQRILNEIDHLVINYGVKNIKFSDELFLLNRKHVESICDGIIERGYDLNIWCYARVDNCPPKVLEKMKRAGINWICLGIESGNAQVRKDVSKKYRSDSVFSAVKAIREDAGIYIIGNYLFGLPEDNLASMQETLDLAVELNCEFANFYSVMAYPGSKLYERSKALKLPLPETWNGFSQHAYDTLPLPTNYVSGKEVLKFRDEAFHTYFTNSSYLKMIQAEFGDRVASHIKDMTKNRLPRKFI